MSTAPTVDLAREARHGRIAGACALVSMLCTLAAVPVAASGTPSHRGGSSDLRLLLDVGLGDSAQTAAMVLRVVGLLLLIPVALHLYALTRGRNPEHSRAVTYIAFTGILLQCVMLPLGFVEVRDVAQTFINSGPRSAERAKDLLEAKRDSAGLRIANIGQIIGGIVFGVWISLSSMEATRVGLLTRFLGIFGLGAGITTAIGIPVGSALFLGWLGSIGVLMLGYWPGGRPPAWEEGRAVTWDEVDARTPGHVGRAAR
jgi:hypothetical protein